MARKVEGRRVGTRSLDAADADQLFTVEQTAQLLAISDWMVRKHIRSALLPAVFIEGMTRIRAADIREYIAARRHCADDVTADCIA